MENTKHAKAVDLIRKVIYDGTIEAQNFCTMNLKLRSTSCYRQLPIGDNASCG